VARNSILLEAGDPDAVREVLAGERDVAAVILEPLGAATGMVPVTGRFLEALRELTLKHGVLLIFDEVITGFRVSPGGVQAAVGVTPDLTTLAKILAGGLPGGAVAGRKEILDGLDFAVSRSKGREKIYHPGTFNANPVSAVAGTAALEVIAESQACAHAAETARLLRQGLCEVLAELGVAWGVYGESSAFHIHFNRNGQPLNPFAFDPLKLSREELQDKPPALLRQLRLALLVNGVDLAGWPGGLTSLAHGQEHVTETVEAFRASLAMLRRDGLL